MSTTPSPRLSLAEALERLKHIQTTQSYREWRLVIRKTNPGGMTAHQTTEVQSIHAGFDWEAGRVILTPARPLTELTPDQVEALHQSVKAGGSWHAEQREMKLRARIAELEAELERLKSNGNA